MSIGEILRIPYSSCVLLFQIMILGATLFLLLHILQSLKIHPPFASAAILYLGFSPAYVNSALRLLSEIITYPLVLGLVIYSHRTWISWKNETNFKRNVFVSCVLAFLLVMTKGILEAVFPVFFLCFLFICYRHFRTQKQFKKFFLAFCLIFLTTYHLPLITYKFLNKYFNGYYTLTDRGGWALYGNTARRMLPVTGKQLLQALSYGPDARWCESIWTQEECILWSYETSDELGVKKRVELTSQGLSKSKMDTAFMRESAKLVLQNPIQYLLLYLIEIKKMFQWETTHDAFVVYPTWLTNLFQNLPFEITICVLTTMLSLAGFIYCAFSTWQHRRELVNDTSTSLIALIILFIGLFIAAHGFFLVLTRYIFPIVPLYIILATAMMDRFFHKRV